MDTLVRRRRFTVDEYECMGRAGILHEDERVELIDGEVIEMPPIGPGHAGDTKQLNQLFSSRLGARAIVSVQDPIRLPPGAEPEPDIALLVPRPDFYRAAHPGPDAVLLIVEVADTSLAYDRDVKVPMYAAAGIPEVWVVDVAGERVLVYREPHAGGYRQTTTVERGGVIAPAAFPDLVLRVDEILG